MSFTYSAHQTTYENLLKTRLILEMKFNLEIEIFKVKGADKVMESVFWDAHGILFIEYLEKGILLSDVLAPSKDIQGGLEWVAE